MGFIRGTSAMFDLQTRFMLRALSHDHRYDSALIAQRQQVLTAYADNRAYHGLYPFIPVLWSTDPKWYANLNLTSMVREERLLRELDSMRNLEEVPDRPYFMFGVEEGFGVSASGRRDRTISDNERRNGLTAAEILCLIFFSGNLTWQPRLTYVAGGSEFEDGSLAIFGFVDGHMTFRADLDKDTTIPQLVHRECFL